MKLFKQAFAFALTLILFAYSLCYTIPVLAYNKDEHNAIMRQVLFKDRNTGLEKNTSPKNNKHNKEVEALELACYLAIDQYNGNGESELKSLKQFGVKRLPSDISVIDYKDGPYHRRKTHRGWDFPYPNDTDQKRWEIRRKILTETADKVFDFDGDEIKRDSFCAILYYTHILGDRIADEKYYQNIVIMEVGGRKDKYDICNELKTNIEILFEDQKGTNKYTRVLSKIKKYNSRIAKLPITNSSKLTDEEFAEYQECAEDLLKTLELYLPAMLKDEVFFAEVFYS